MNSSLERRIRQHIIGKEKTFFITATPGFTQVLKKEVEETLPEAKNISVVSGGVLFTGKLPQMMVANLYLRTAGRILMRIDRFWAEGFPQLEKLLAKIPWELYLFPGQPVQFEVSAHQSRLYHTGALAELCKEVIFQTLKLAPVAPDPEIAKIPQKIFVRVQRDEFTFSIDTSGDLLYRRGLKSMVGAAPLRETVASGILQTVGYMPSMILVDPMCGAGTFSIEAAMMSNHIAPGFFRNFAFQGWPSFPSKTWNHLTKKAASECATLPSAHIYASDINDISISQLQATLEKFSIITGVSTQKVDFFQIAPSPEKGLIIINPPYGQRLGAPKQAKELMQKICINLQKKYIGWQFAIIGPKELLLSDSFLLKNAQTHPFTHGGLPLVLRWGKIE